VTHRVGYQHRILAQILSTISSKSLTGITVYSTTNGRVGGRLSAGWI